MKVHMYQCSLSMAGPARTYCGRVDADGRLQWTYDREDVDCETCIRAMVAERCLRCEKKLGGSPEERCNCYREDER